MKPLFVLLRAFTISLLVTKLLTKTFDYSLSGRIAMAVMLVFTAIGHFAFTKGMTMMLPDFIPFKTEVVYLTGVIEIIAAAGLLIPNFRTWTGWALMLFFVLLWPGNIKAAIHRIDYQKGTFDGNGPNYLWFRFLYKSYLLCGLILPPLDFNGRWTTSTDR